MKKVFIVFSVVITILLVSSFFISCAPKSGGPVKLRLSMGQPPMDFLVITTMETAERFNERVGGEYIMEVYPASQLCAMAENLDAVRNGVIEMMCQPLGAYTGTIMELSAIEIPFMFDSVESNAAAAQESLTKHYNDILNEWNVKVLSSTTIGGWDIISTKPIKTLDDWKGLLVVVDNPQGMTLIKTLGGSPVTMPFIEGYAALQKNIAEAMLTSPEAAVALKLYETTDYMTVFYGIGTSVSYAINMDVFNKMPKKVQSILIEETGNAAQMINNAMIDRYDQHIDIMASNGIDVYYLPKAERDKWKDLLHPYMEEQLSILGEPGQEIKDIADEVNSEYPYRY